MTKPKQTEAEWLADQVQRIKGLKTPTQQQALMVLLAENPARTDLEGRKLAAIIRAEKAAIRAAKARSAADSLLQAESKKQAEADRKARNHRLIVQGALVDLAGLGGRDRGELVGLFLAAQNATDTDWAGWKSSGDALLAQRAAELAEFDKPAKKPAKTAAPEGQQFEPVAEAYQQPAQAWAA